ncbi:MAG: FAD-dependent oxidoreductase [Thermoprotei archaeon]
MRVAVVGAGITGLFTSLDLAMRGFDVTVFDRGDIGSGTSGRYHGMLHSGARYVVSDPKAAKECAVESNTLARMVPSAVDDTGGIFVAVKGDDEGYVETFLSALKREGIDHRVIDLSELASEEPYVTREAREAIWVHDRIAYAYDFMAGIAIEAARHGVKIKPFNEVVSLVANGGHVSGVKVKDSASGAIYDFYADEVVNASGPWANTLLASLGKKISMIPALGAMVVYPQRLVNHVINRLRPPSDGDIVLPYGGHSVLGTTASFVEDPDKLEVAEEDIELLIDEGSMLVPSLSQMKAARVYSAVRPLLAGDSAREASRDFSIMKDDGLVTVFGGKFTTARLMGEAVADVVCDDLGVRSSGQTSRVVVQQPSRDELIELADKHGIPRDLLLLFEGRKGTADEERYNASLNLLLSLLARSDQ